MKTLMIIPLIVLSASNVDNVETRASVQPFTSINVSPFYLGRDSKIVVQTNSKNFSFKLFIKNDLYEEKEILNKSITKAGEYIYTYNNAYTRTSNQIYLKYMDNGVEVTSALANRNLSSGTTRLLDGNPSLTSSNKIALLKYGSPWIYQRITYEFENFEGLYVPDFYHKLDLSSFRINLGKTYKPFFYCEPTLILSNENGMFDDVTGVGETAYFDLKYVEDGNSVYLALKDKLYVNKDNLSLSSSLKLFYVQTRHIYFPRNSMKDQDKIKGQIIFYDFSIDRDTLIYSFEVKALKNIFGDCHNSEYCVVRES